MPSVSRLFCRATTIPPDNSLRERPVQEPAESGGNEEAHAAAMQVQTPDPDSVNEFWAQAVEVEVPPPESPAGAQAAAVPVSAVDTFWAGGLPLALLPEILDRPSSTAVACTTNRFADAARHGEFPALNLFEPRTIGELREACTHIHPSVVDLKCIGLALTDSEMHAIVRAFPNLRVFHADMCNALGHDGIHALAGLADLEALRLERHPFRRSTRITPQSFLKLPPGLTSLDLRDFEIENLVFVARLAKLTRLNVQACWLSNVAGIGRCTELTALGLGHAELDDACLQEIGTLGKLQHLAVSCRGITDRGIESIANLPLVFLGLRARITSEALQGRFGALQELRLEDATLLDGGHLPGSIKRLTLHACDVQFDLSGLPASLMRFEVCTVVGDTEEWSSQLSRLPSLREMAIFLDREEMAALEARRPDITVLRPPSRFHFTGL